jgi:hypothetical protein
MGVGGRRCSGHPASFRTLDQVRRARSVSDRRSLRWVEAEVGRAAFEGEVRRRGWHLVECNGQLVVFCTPRPIKVLF